MTENKEKRFKGRVVFFDPRRGWGYIQSDDDIGETRVGTDIFAHFSQVQSEGFKTLKAEQYVEFSLGKNDRGVMATNIIVLEV